MSGLGDVLALALPGALTAAATAALCGALGVLLVLRSNALMGDAVGHAALPGVCAAWLLSGSDRAEVLLLGALAAALVTVGVGAWLRTLPRTRPDSVLATTLAASFGLGALLYSFAQLRPGFGAAGLGTFLLGNAAAVQWPLALATCAVVVVAALALVVGWRLVATSVCDAAWAASSGLPVRLANGAMDAALAVTVVVSVRAMGAILVASMLVVPAAAALLLRLRLAPSALVAAAIGAGAGLIGTAVSVRVPGVATGPAMVLACGVALAATAARRLAVGAAPRPVGGVP